MAKDYADSLAKHVKAKEALSNNWFYSFLKWWSNLKVVKPQKLSIARAKPASRETLDNYYKELSTGLGDIPQNRATEILKSKSVRSTDDVIDVIRT